jgi:hypothetical protein
MRRGAAGAAPCIVAGLIQIHVKPPATFSEVQGYPNGALPLRVTSIADTFYRGGEGFGAGVTPATETLRTNAVFMNATLSADEEVIRKARQRAESMGTRVNRLARQYVKALALAGRNDAEAEAGGRRGSSSFTAETTRRKFELMGRVRMVRVQPENLVRVIELHRCCSVSFRDVVMFKVGRIGGGASSAPKIWLPAGAAGIRVFDSLRGRRICANLPLARRLLY